MTNFRLPATLLLACTPLLAVADAVPALDRLIDASLLASPVLGARRSDVAAARSDVDAARWQYTPAVSFDSQQGSGPSSLNGQVLRVDQKLYAGGRLDADLRGANARRDSAILAVRENALALALQIVDAYKMLAASNSQIAAIGEYGKRLDALDATITRRIESGVSAPADRALMNARIVQSKNDLSSALATRRNAVATLDRLVGNSALVEALAATPAADAASADTDAGACAVDARTDALRDEVLTRVLDANPSLQRIEQDIAAARAAAEAQRAAARPNVGVRLEQPIAPAADATLRSTRVSLVVSFTLDAGLSSLARAQGASERVASLVQQADALRRDVVQQLRSECAELRAAGERAAGFAQAKVYTADAVASSTRLFVAGKRGWLDLLNTAREDFDNEQAGIAARAARSAARYRVALLANERPLELPGVADETPSDLRRSFRALFQ